MSSFRPWRIVHLSLREPIPDLSADSDCGGLFLVFWWDRIPLGHFLVPAASLPFPSGQLTVVISRVIAPAVGFHAVRRGFEPPLPVPEATLVATPPPQLNTIAQLENPLLSLDALQRANGAAPLLISVVVCTRNRPDHLENCLSAIEALSPAPYEVVVVDNDPGSGQTRPVVERHPTVRYVEEDRGGLSAARNAGIQAAKGDVVAFTDDDVIVHSAWIRAIGDAFADRTAMAMTGLVLPAELSTPAQFAFQTDVIGARGEYRPIDFDEAFFRATRRVGAPVWRLGAGANMAFRREVFERVGRFDERLGAGASGCSEDSELWYRLLADGYRCRYWPEAVVLHRHRADWPELRRQLHLYMRGHVTGLFVQFERSREWGNLYRALWELPRHLFHLAYHRGKRWIGRRFYDPPDGMVTRPVLPQLLGALAGYGYYLRHSTQRPGGTMTAGAQRHASAGS
jgi:GT2 family glycosyltransferase